MRSRSMKNKGSSGRRRHGRYRTRRHGRRRGGGGKISGQIRQAIADEIEEICTCYQFFLGWSQLSYSNFRYDLSKCEKYLSTIDSKPPEANNAYRDSRRRELLEVLSDLFLFNQEYNQKLQDAIQSQQWKTAVILRYADRNEGPETCKEILSALSDNLPNLFELYYLKIRVEVIRHAVRFIPEKKEEPPQEKKKSAWSSFGSSLRTFPNSLRSFFNVSSSKPASKAVQEHNMSFENHLERVPMIDNPARKHTLRIHDEHQQQQQQQQLQETNFEYPSFRDENDTNQFFYNNPMRNHRNRITANTQNLDEQLAVMKEEEEEENQDVEVMNEEVGEEQEQEEEEDSEDESSYHRDIQEIADQCAAQEAELEELKKKWKDCKDKLAQENIIHVVLDRMIVNMQEPSLEDVLKCYVYFPILQAVTDFVVQKQGEEEGEGEEEAYSHLLHRVETMKKDFRNVISNVFTAVVSAEERDNTNEILDTHLQQLERLQARLRPDEEDQTRMEVYLIQLNRSLFDYYDIILRLNEYTPGMYVSPFLAEMQYSCQQWILRVSKMQASSIQEQWTGPWQQFVLDLNNALVSTNFNETARKVIVGCCQNVQAETFYAFASKAAEVFRTLPLSYDECKLLRQTINDILRQTLPAPFANIYKLADLLKHTLDLKIHVIEGKKNMIVNMIYNAELPVILQFWHPNPEYYDKYKEVNRKRAYQMISDIKPFSELMLAESNYDGDFSLQRPEIAAEQTQINAMVNCQVVSRQLVDSMQRKSKANRLEVSSHITRMRYHKLDRMMKKYRSLKSILEKEKESGRFRREEEDQKISQWLDGLRAKAELELQQQRSANQDLTAQLQQQIEINTQKLGELEERAKMGMEEEAQSKLQALQSLAQTQKGLDDANIIAQGLRELLEEERAEKEDLLQKLREAQLGVHLAQEYQATLMSNLEEARTIIAQKEKQVEEIEQENKTLHRKTNELDIYKEHLTTMNGEKYKLESTNKILDYRIMSMQQEMEKNKKLSADTKKKLQEKINQYSEMLESKTHEYNALQEQYHTLLHMSMKEETSTPSPIPNAEQQKKILTEIAEANEAKEKALQEELKASTAALEVAKKALEDLKQEYRNVLLSKQEQNDKNQELARLNDLLEFTVQEWQEKNSRALLAVEERDQEIDSLENQLEKKNRRIASLQKKNDQLILKRDYVMQQLSDNSALNQQRVEEANREIEKVAKEKQRLEQEVARSRETNSSLEDEVREWKQLYQEELQNWQADLAAMEQEKKELESKLASAATTGDNREEIQAALEELKRQSSEEKALLEQNLQIQNNNDLNALKEQHAKNLQILQTELQKQQEEQKAIQQQLAQVTANAVESNVLQAKLKTIVKANRKKENNIQRLLRQKKESKKDIRALESEIAALKSKNEAELAKALESLRKTNQEKSQLETLRQTDNAEHQGKLEAATRKSKRLNNYIRKLQRANATKSNQLGEKSQEIQTLQDELVNLRTTNEAEQKALREQLQKASDNDEKVQWEAQLKAAEEENRRQQDAISSRLKSLQEQGEANESRVKELEREIIMRKELSNDAASLLAEKTSELDFTREYLDYTMDKLHETASDKYMLRMNYLSMLLEFRTAADEAKIEKERVQVLLQENEKLQRKLQLAKKRISTVKTRAKIQLDRIDELLKAAEEAAVSRSLEDEESLMEMEDDEGGEEQMLEDIALSDQTIMNYIEAKIAMQVEDYHERIDQLDDFQEFVETKIGSADETNEQQKVQELLTLLNQTEKNIEDGADASTEMAVLKMVTDVPQGKNPLSALINQSFQYTYIIEEPIEEEEEEAAEEAAPEQEEPQQEEEAAPKKNSRKRKFVEEINGFIDNLDEEIKDVFPTMKNRFIIIEPPTDTRPTTSYVNTTTLNELEEKYRQENKAIEESKRQMREELPQVVGNKRANTEIEPIPETEVVVEEEEEQQAGKRRRPDNASF